MSLILKLLTKVRGRLLDQTSGQPVAGVAVSLSIALGNGNRSTIPVGTLRTDATGYFAFDLRPFINRDLGTASGLLVSAPRVGLKDLDLLKSLAASRDENGAPLMPTSHSEMGAGGAKGAEAISESGPLELGFYHRYLVSGVGTGTGTAMERGATKVAGQPATSVDQPKPLCIEFPIYVTKPRANNEESGCESAHLISIQAPDAGDYKLSPYSFVTPAKIRGGGGCCETLAPSTLPVQEYGFQRVIVVRGQDEPSFRPGFKEFNPTAQPVFTTAQPVFTTAQPVFNPVNVNAFLPEPVSAAIRFGEVLEYRQRWYALGHSLGEIKYSLPLAPGESTQLAVIEWGRQDTISRFDEVKGQEFLSHLQRRDRSIEESVDAGLKETQGGWSFMHGHSTAAAYDAKAYGQYTGNAATGFGTSHSWGNREVEADSRQDLHDQVVQGTTYVRSLTSTVIVQASQAEQSQVQTRRVANHNHCHALTIQYYEVLRHFRIHTEFVRRRKAIVIPFAPFSFDATSALRFRTLLEQALLDESLLPYFDALVRLGLDLYPQKPTDAGVSTGPQYFTGPLADLVVDSQDFPLRPKDPRDPQGAYVKIEKGSTVHITAKAQGRGLQFPIEYEVRAPHYDVDGQVGTKAPEGQGWPLPNANSFALLAKIGPDFYEVGKDLAFETKNEGELSLWFNDAGPQEGNSGTAKATVSVSAPPASGSPDKEKVPATIQDPKDADTIKQGFLLKHLNGNIGYYNRAVWFLMDPVERRLYLELALGADSALLDAIDDRPIAVSGSRVAFAYDGPVPDDGVEVADDAHDAHEALESIITLPTRGLFAEAQLGHCNSCEKRDVTRMWDWNEMTAEEPPAITGIEPGPRGQTPTITPTQLPSNVIQIAPTPAAPDPVGLAAALKLLGTPNIFRDMSGLDEVSTILGKLVDGSTATLAEMVKGAAAAKQKVDEARTGKSAGSSETTGANGTAPKGRTQPNEKDAKSQVDRLQAIEDAKNRDLIGDEHARNAALGVLGGEVIPVGSIDRNVNGPWGIDVSHFQGIINWEKVAATSNMHFAFIKASDGEKFRDPKFAANRQGARAAGLACGAYHFWRPDVAGKKQAELLISQIGTLRIGELPPVLDVEDNPKSNFRGLSPSDHEDNIQEFIDRTYAEFGVYPIIYTSAPFWRDPRFLNDSTKFSSYLLWIAAWNPQLDPALPGGWPTWDFWQMTDEGRVDGATGGQGGKVDVNMFNGDLVSLWQMAGRDYKVVDL